MGGLGSGPRCGIDGLGQYKIHVTDHSVLDGHPFIKEGCILSCVAGASEEEPVGPRRSEFKFINMTKLFNLSVTFGHVWPFLKKFGPPCISGHLNRPAKQVCVGPHRKIPYMDKKGERVHCTWYACTACIKVALFVPAIPIQFAYESNFTLKADNRNSIYV